MNAYWMAYIDEVKPVDGIDAGDPRAYEAVRLDLIANMSSQMGITVNEAEKLFDTTSVAECCGRNQWPILHEDYKQLIDEIYEEIGVVTFSADGIIE